LLTLGAATGWAADKYSITNGEIEISTIAKTMKINKLGDELEIYSLNKVQDHLIYKISDTKYEFGIKFTQQPTSNVILFRMNGWENFDFLFQPPLAHLNADGSTSNYNTYGGTSTRPENINNSYAVYWKDKKNNEYKTGKYCHIYRVFVEAKDKTRAWCDMSISSGIITITIPYDFWAKKELDYLDPTQAEIMYMLCKWIQQLQQEY
jgi:hypothetical protein